MNNKKGEKMEKKTFREELEEMEVGESKVFSADDSLSIRSQCSQYGIAWDMRFSTKSNRTQRTITVTRTK